MFGYKATAEAPRAAFVRSRANGVDVMNAPLFQAVTPELRPGTT
jgi:hypothetical protein